MNPDVQKVLDFIREGANAAAGPAKWGFEQMCAYQASREMAWLVSVFTLFAVFLAAAIFSVRATLREDFDSDWNTKDLVTTVIAFVGVIGTAVFAITIMSTFSGSYATIRNPAGAVLNGIVRRQ